jgi:hypothetical protein
MISDVTSNDSPLRLEILDDKNQAVYADIHISSLSFSEKHFLFLSLYLDRVCRTGVFVFL